MKYSFQHCEGNAKRVQYRIIRYYVSMNYKLIRQRCNRFAADYEKVYFLQKEMGKRLLQRMEYIKLTPEVIVDLGAATGWLSAALSEHFPEASIVALDFAEQRLQQSKLYPCQPVVADMHAIALQSDTVDLIVANDSLHWAVEPAMVVKECLRVLKPGGLLMFTTLGPDSLLELRLACRDAGIGDRVKSFMDMHDMGDMLQQGGFSDPVMDRETLQLQYRKVETLCRDIHRHAASQVDQVSSKGLLTPGQWAHLLGAYPTDHPEIYPCTIELLQGHAWKLQQSNTSRMDEKGEISVHISNIRRKK